MLDTKAGAQKAAQDTQDLIYAVNEFGVYCIPESYQHRTVPKMLREGRVYERRTLGFIARMCGSGDVISGGAFVGDFLPAISAALGARAKLHTFEPAPLTYDACARTVALNKLKNVALHQVAVGAEAARLPLQIGEPSGDVAAAKAKILDGAVEGETVEVEVVPLDDLVAKTRKVSVLHLDIEGHEAPALTGAARLIGDNRPLIVLEAEKPRDARAFLEQLNAEHPKAKYGLAGRMERNAMFLPDIGA
ncbi:MAG: FkbM family methyltransferase [Pseudomonadota bacterium]